MAIRNFSGGETGDLYETRNFGGTVSVQGSVKNSGDYAYRCNPLTTAVGWFAIGGQSATTGASATLNIA
jgi:hypothetical protein